MNLRTVTLALLLPVIALTSALTAHGQPKRFYIAPDDHTDYYWIADGEAYREAFLRMTDYYLDKMDETAGLPSDQQMRWSADGSFWMWEYERNRTPQQFERMIERVRDGHLSVPLNPLVLVNGGAPAEAVLRGMYYSGLIERRHNVRFPMAIAMENQTQPFGLSSLWAGSGAKYSWKGVCNCATRVTGLETRDREIYYSGGRDGSRVLMKWHSQYAIPGVVFNQGYGGYSEAYDPLLSIEYAEENALFRSRYDYPVIGAFGRGYDDLIYLSDEFVDVARDHTTPDRRIIVSNQEDFFADFEAEYGHTLETYAASFGNEWDVLVASMAELSARVKRHTEKLRGAEAMATLVLRHEPGFMDSRIAERDLATIDLGLYFEHDWTADGAISRDVRAGWSREVEREIGDYVERLDRDARYELGRQISRSGGDPRFFVFNPLSWTRTGHADIPFRDRRTVHVVDVSTGQEVPSQIIRYGNKRILRIQAADVPPVGYKVYEIRSGRGGAVFSDAATIAGRVIENQFYRLTLADDGTVTSLVDRTRADRELVRSIGGRRVNDLGGDGTGKIWIENRGPVSVTLRAVTSSPLERSVRITFFRGSDRIEIENQILENFGDVKTLAFSLDINDPNVWHEEVGAVIRARLLGGGGHYAERNSRYDWLTMNHFADISDGSAGDFGVTISNADAYFMKLGGSTPGSLDTSTPQINVLVGGQVDGPQLGIPDQGGDRFLMQRFALRTNGGFDQTAAMKFSLEHQNPFSTGLVEGFGEHARPYPADSFSLLRISDPNVLLWAVKPAEDGISRGIVARVWNQSSEPVQYTLELAGGISSAEKVTHIETHIANADASGGRLNATVTGQQIQTHLLKP